jgi:hypothetical protein
VLERFQVQGSPKTRLLFYFQVLHNEAEHDLRMMISTGELGVEVIKVDLSDAAAVKGSVAGKSYTHVFDNFAKDTATCTLAETAKDSWGVKSYTYVSSAGMYKSDTPQPMKEDG